MPAPRHQSNPNADPRSPTGSKRHREAQWAAERQARVVANRERGGSRRNLARAGATRNAQPKRRPATPPLALLASALSAGVSLRQAAGDLGISRFELNRALKQETVRRAGEEAAATRRRARELLCQLTATEPPKRRLLALAAEPLASALAAGVALRQAAADLGLAPSSLTRALERAEAPDAAEYLRTIRAGYDYGQERQQQCRRRLQEAGA